MPRYLICLVFVVVVGRAPRRSTVSDMSDIEEIDLVLNDPELEETMRRIGLVISHDESQPLIPPTVNPSGRKNCYKWIGFSALGLVVVLATFFILARRHLI
jgi:hypothetical protein